MSFWTGTQWVPVAPAPTVSRASRLRVGLAALLEGALIASILAFGAVALSPVSRPAAQFADLGLAQAGRLGTITVSFGDVITDTAATATTDAGSAFAARGCGFRADASDYYMVVKGPAPSTSSVAYWVDPFPVDGRGCGAATVSWSSSGVPGDFDVYVVRSASGNPWQARPASNIVTLTIVSP